MKKECGKPWVLYEKDSPPPNPRRKGTIAYGKTKETSTFISVEVIGVAPPGQKAKLIYPKGQKVPPGLNQI